MADFFSSYFGFSLLVVFLFILSCGGVSLLLRPLVLWYFKIYTISSELQKNNALLREIRDELRKRNIQDSTFTQKTKEDYSKYMPK